MYTRANVYPNGAPIPSVLPDSYQSSMYGNTPAGQSCSNCKNFNTTNFYCEAWKAPVKPRWWCNGWAPVSKLTRHGTVAVLSKKITTSTVEEHFAEVPDLTSKQISYGYENEEDVIKLNVPLMIRLLEWAREGASKDVELHIVAERLIDLSDEGDTLTMSDYPDIVVQETTVDKKEN